MAEGTWRGVLPYVVVRLHDQPKVISALLCTSRAVAEVVLQSCPGTIELRCQMRSEAQAPQGAPFLAKYARLLKALKLQLPEDRQQRLNAEQLLILALATASTGVAGVQVDLPAGSSSCDVRMQHSCRRQSAVAAAVAATAATAELQQQLPQHLAAAAACSQLQQKLD